MFDVPIGGTGRAPAELPFAISVAVRIDDSGLIESAEVVSEQALPIAAVVAADGLSASGTLPRVFYPSLGVEEAVFTAREFDAAQGPGRVSMTPTTWTYTLTNPPTDGQPVAATWAMWSEGLGLQPPDLTPTIFVDPRDDYGEEDDPRDPWPRVPIRPPELGVGEQTDNPTGYLAPWWDAVIGRIPGSDPDNYDRDMRCGLQVADVFVEGPPQRGECC